MSGRLGGDALGRLGDAAGAGHLIAVRFQRRLEEAQDRRLVVHDQNLRLCAHAGTSSRGNVSMMRVPRPPATGLSAAIEPPCASMMPLAMARPSPVPCPPSACVVSRLDEFVEYVRQRLRPECRDHRR